MTTPTDPILEQMQDAELVARRFVGNSAHPEDALKAVRAVLYLLDATREYAAWLLYCADERVKAAETLAQQVDTLAQQAEESAKTLAGMVQQTEAAMETIVVHAETRGARWALDHCHDLAVADGRGKPNTTVDRDAVAATIVVHARTRASHLH
jgi:hypothetical protein